MPIKKIVDLASEKKIPVLVDGCQGAPHLKIDMQELGCDFYAISCHKMYGPTGVGVLYAKKKWLEVLPPYQGGGGMIEEVKKDSITFPGSPTKFEAGTLQTAEVVGFSESIRFIQDIGIKNIMTHENKILEYGLEEIKKNNSVKVIGEPKNRGSIISLIGRIAPVTLDRWVIAKIFVFGVIFFSILSMLISPFSSTSAKLILTPFDFLK